MICPTSITSTPVTAPKTFQNWARALTFTAAKSYAPSTRGEIVEIIREAEAARQHVKWTGSRWSFMGNFVSSDVVIESDAVTGAIDTSLIIDRLTLADPSLSGALAHIRGGTKVFNVNRILHGLPPALNGGGADEINLDCTPVAGGPAPRALPTLGGSGGQSIAGVMATGSHGGDVALPPIADAVMAIHLIGPGGQEWWIERSSGLTTGTEADTRLALSTIATTVPGADVEMCSGVLVKKDDDLFRAALVSVGRMGFVYALVIQTVPAFKLTETRKDLVWEIYETNLTAVNFPHFVKDKRFLQVLINPFGNNGSHDCKVAERVVADCSTRNAGMGAGGFDITSLICRQVDVRVFMPILLVALVALIGAEAGLIALASAEFAAAVALAAIPFVGWALAAAMFAVWAATWAAIAALAAAIVALTALIAYLTLAGSLTAGDLIAAIANFAYAFGLKGLMTALLTMLFDSGYPILTKTGISWKIMDTYGYPNEDFCQKVDSMEIAFDVERTAGGGYLGFIDDALAIFDDLFNRNVAVAGIMALRYTRQTTALIGMSKFPTTCHIEIPILRNFAGNGEFLARVQRAAIAHGGVPHWGQLMGTYTATDVQNLHGSDLTTWRQKLTDLIAGGGGADFTFSNDFTLSYELEPLGAGLPDDCANGGPFPAVNLGGFSGNGTLEDTEEGDVAVENITNGFSLQLTSLHGGVTLNHKVDQSSFAQFVTCTGVSIGEKVDQHSKVKIVAHGDVSIGQKIDQWSSADITSIKGAISIGQKVDQHSSASLTAATTVHIGQKIDQHSTVTIVAQGDVTIDQGIDQHAFADITSINGSITIGQAVDGNATAILRAPNGNITIVQKVAGGASVTWSALSFTCPDTSGGTVTHV